MSASWQKVISDQVAAKAADARARSTGASDSVRLSRVGIGPAAHPYLVRAAQARGISLAGYIRRATMAMVAVDLGMDAVDLFAIDLPIRPIGRPGEAPSLDLDGELYGRWEVQPDESARRRRRG